MLYVVWPMAFGVAMFMLVLKISFAPPDDQDVERFVFRKTASYMSVSLQYELP